MNRDMNNMMSPVVRNLLIANVAVFVLQIVPALRNHLLFYGWLVPARVYLRGEAWRLLTYMFLHGDPVHLLFNMLALWMFGVELERMWGSRRFTVFYFLGGVGAALFSAFMWRTPIIGASGAVLAVLTAYAFYFPNRRVLMFFVFPVPVRWAVAIIGLMSLLGSMSTVGGIAHITHLGGIVVALAYIRLYPLAVRWIEDWNVRRRQRRAREAVVDRARGERYFEEKIDPILKKVSEQGMDALSAREKKELFEASRTHRERFTRGRIIPFDFNS